MNAFKKLVIIKNANTADSQCELLDELADAGSKNILTIMTALELPDPLVRGYAIKSLERLKSAKTGVIRKLTRALADEDIYVRQCATSALVVLAPNIVSAIPSLIGEGRSFDPDVREFCSMALRELNKEMGCSSDWHTW